MRINKAEIQLPRYSANVNYSDERGDKMFKGVQVIHSDFLRASKTLHQLLIKTLDLPELNDKIKVTGVEVKTASDGRDFFILYAVLDSPDIYNRIKTQRLFAKEEFDDDYVVKMEDSMTFIDETEAYACRQFLYEARLYLEGKYKKMDIDDEQYDE